MGFSETGPWDSGGSRKGRAAVGGLGFNWLDLNNRNSITAFILGR